MAAVTTQIVRVHEMDAIISSSSMAKLMSMVDRVARRNAAVLITGETGTGKELIARAVHSYSLRCSKPWVDINCAALPEHLIESELFGYEKGAFSGADGGKPGLFELADKGTLFLDEVGELDPKLQAKLLRVLDGLPYYRLGGSRKVLVDVRVVAATNRPLEQAAASGKFRSDLYYRLAQLQLRIPPLRERPEDVVALAHYFLEQNHSGCRLSFGAIQALQSYSWPGNVRELRNVILQAATAATGNEITMADLPTELLSAPSSPAPPEEVAAVEHEAPAALETLEKQAIRRALARTRGHQGMAATELGISRRTLSRKLKQYRIECKAESLGVLGESERTYFRASLQVPVSIVTRHGEQTVTSVNVSSGGIAVEGVRDPFQLAAKPSLAFSLPGVPQMITARAQIVWCDAAGRAGLRFTVIEEPHAERLSCWLEQRQAEEGWALHPPPLLPGTASHV